MSWQGRFLATATALMVQATLGASNPGWRVLLFVASAFVVGYAVDLIER